MAKRAVILLVEDGDDDAFLCLRALRDLPIEHRCFHLPDATQCMQYLRGIEPYTDREKFPLPNLLILDLKMPTINGFELLDWLQEQSEFRKLPAVVLSGSDWPKDRERALLSGAKGYYTKPANGADLGVLIQEIGTRWLNHASRESR